MPTVESEAKAKTKVRFEELFRSHAGLTTDKKKPKKKANSQEDIALDTFRSDLDLGKGSGNDEVIINTIYHPKKSLGFTKNKPREESSVADKANIDVISGEENKQIKTNKKKKKTVLQEQFNEEENAHKTLQESFERKINDDSPKARRSKSQSGAPHPQGDKIKNALPEVRVITELDEEEQLIQAYELQVAEDEANAIRRKIRKKLKEQMSEFSTDVQSHEVVLKNEVGKKKKKKKEIPLTSEAETSAMSLSELQQIPVEDNFNKKKSLEGVPASVFSQNDEMKTEEQSTEDDIKLPTPKARKAAKKSKRVSEDNTKDTKPSKNIIQEATRPEVSTQSKCGFDDSHVLGIYIHRTDRLRTNFLISHPMVKIHVIDQNTGTYVKKEHSNRAVSSFYEQEGVEHILPIMTQPYDFKYFKSRLPEWEEQIVFNERLNYFLQESEDSPIVILFFEILDFLSMDEARANSEVQVQESGFRKIAWAFLKLVGANGVLNINGKLRLQLYTPPSRTRSQLNVVEVFEWWSKCPRNRYPSTLYVTIKGLKLPDHVDPSFRSMMALQQEQGNTSYCDLQKETTKGTESDADDKSKELVKWSRLPGQVCRIPNRHHLSLRAGERGCFSINFSPNGRILAAACAGRDGYPIILYEIPSGCFLRELCGHLNIVYDLCWSKDNQHLLSASSDGTVRLWKVENQGAPAIKVFPHPSFVYTAKFHPIADYLVVTGCYDSVIRVWNVKVKEVHGQLLQEFDGHKHFINSLCFDAEGLHMFSGDSSGLIIVWNTFVKGSSQQHPVRHWGINKEIRENDIKGIPISHLEVHPNGRRLLIHAKDSTLRIMDLRILATRKYVGATNYREKIHSTLTPCGTFLFSGSEDGIAYVWNPETGDQVAMYSDLSFTSPLRDVAFHPLEHMVAFCAFGQNEPILVYIYDYSVAQREAEMVKESSGSLASAGAHRNPQILSNPAMQDPTISPADQFASAARMSMRMQKVKHKLESVTASSNLLLPAPSLCSPHSKLRLPSMLGTHLIPQHSCTTQSGGFSPVGKPLNRMPSVTLPTVVALYDYPAHRSDELTIHRGDIIQVLYKDNDNWWFGCLASGQQGYFPANYVAGETQNEDVQSSEIVHDSSPLLPHEQTEAEKGPTTPRKLSAVLRQSVDLHFTSEHDTYLDSPVTQGAGRKKKKEEEEEERQTDAMTEIKPNLTARRTSQTSGAVAQIESKVAPPGLSAGSKNKKRTGIRAKRTGRANVAFEPNC
ncbi:jouberin isoform X2 [Ornithorhynchus anatinus]|uniref:Jouberin n=1 Tax=Ornithorhynchus anatinus TaxID=9258 RepID=A0A6I8P0P8_ORNAN|nr:jouberin isoform X2 [Ornithorhynchus anatinus]